MTCSAVCLCLCQCAARPMITVHWAHFDTLRQMPWPFFTTARLVLIAASIVGHSLFIILPLRIADVLLLQRDNIRVHSYKLVSFAMQMCHLTYCALPGSVCVRATMFQCQLQSDTRHDLLCRRKCLLVPCPSFIVQIHHTNGHSLLSESVCSLIGSAVCVQRAVCIFICHLVSPR